MYSIWKICKVTNRSLLNLSECVVTILDPVSKTSVFTSLSYELGAEKFQSLDLDTVQHLWDKLPCRLQARLYHVPFVDDLTCAVLVQWEQIPAVRPQNVVEILILIWKLFPEECRLFRQHVNEQSWV